MHNSGQKSQKRTFSPFLSPISYEIIVILTSKCISLYDNNRANRRQEDRDNELEEEKILNLERKQFLVRVSIFSEPVFLEAQVLVSVGVF